MNQTWKWTFAIFATIIYVQFLIFFCWLSVSFHLDAQLFIGLLVEYSRLHQKSTLDKWCSYIFFRIWKSCIEFSEIFLSAHWAVLLLNKSADSECCGSSPGLWSSENTWGGNPLCAWNPTIWRSSGDPQIMDQNFKCKCKTGWHSFFFFGPFHFMFDIPLEASIQGPGLLRLVILISSYSKCCAEDQNRTSISSLNKS